MFREDRRPQCLERLALREAVRFLSSAFDRRALIISKQLFISTVISPLYFVGVLGLNGASAQIVVPWQSPTGLEVPAGCESPKISATRRTFYVDPMNGSASGDGSEAHPWNSLKDLLANGLISDHPRDADLPGNAAKVPQGAPIRPGDVILLENGNYGNIKIQGYYGSGKSELIAYDNSDFITIEAAPGAHPVLGDLLVTGGAKWIFRGLRIENVVSKVDRTSPYGHLVALLGPHHDIIFDHNTVRSSAETSEWSQADWLANAADGVMDEGQGYNGASCITITNNTIENIGNGIQSQRSDKVLIKGNTINYFIHDGIDYASNNMTIQNNVETNHIDAGDSAHVHPDFMQGQPWGCTPAAQNCDTLSNVVIDSNIAIRQTDPNLPFAKISLVAGAIQGIDTFDGQWYNVKVTNNVVITTTYHGIAYYGVHGAVIANNIVLSDGNSSSFIPWITIQNQKSHTVSSDIVIRNNITSGLNYAAETVGMQVDHNICIATKGRCNLALVFEGKLGHYSMPGEYGDHNLLDVNDASALFKKFTVVDGCVTALDLNLLSKTPAVGTGNPENAPTTDITGAARTLPYDLGAYRYGSSAPAAIGAKTEP